MMFVKPLTQSQINWPDLLQMAGQALGRSITRGLDSERMEIDSYRSFLVALTDIQNPGIKSRDAMQVANEVLSHLHFGFIVYCDDPEMLLQLLAKAETRILRSGDLTVISGSLREWKLSIESYLTAAESNKTIRLFYDKILLYFEIVGISDLFKPKRGLPDGTFILEQ